MEIPLFRKLHVEGLIPEESLRKAETLESQRLFSLHWELKLLLYLGVVLLSGGLGILVYKHIDTIGHQAVLAFIALVSAGSFLYCARKKPSFHWGKMAAADAVYDYILLLACLSLLTFVGYLQYAYEVFGHHYGLATFIPMILLFISAYYFDHLGVLSLAVTNLAAWAGIAITPLHLLQDSNFANDQVIYTGILLGWVLMAAGRWSSQSGRKAHFEPTYTNFGFHLYFVAALAGLFTHDSLYLLWFLVFAAIAWFLYTQAMARRSFYFVVFIVLYTYIALSYVVVQLLENIQGNGFNILVLGLLYFILSAVGVGSLLIRLNRKLKNHERL
ncbi:DUF2157 domain-containing protein [Flavitalea sp. BT771]|uniref:DUF2157 domain-containing protein n=1 Tax=Flavitalea sp. BT771 TaxID=3063329 RepID=UPI0026E31982|nr:DUF2157 domain-containing protein [Flavitalea sp. BT771]MDO6433105.1 DUF2157 domain-containing protein [Flavitalea sp. BT771]MDV6221619.1 DUF2157 domain-containing protein [Flavitalea sp. BT771]